MATKVTPKVTRIEKGDPDLKHKGPSQSRDWGWLKMPEEDKESRNLEITALAVSGEAGNLVVRDDETLQVARALVVRIAEIKKGIKARKDLLLKPIKNQLVKPMEKFFRMIEAPIKEADDRLRDSIVRYRMERKREEEELRELLKEVEEDGVILPPMELHRENVMELENGKIGSTTVWKHEVLDVEEIPHEILVGACRTKRGEEALDQAIRGMIAGGARKIPGVRIFESESLSVTAFEG
jgi:hypothetical protein